jgi:hypothetical protein
MTSKKRRFETAQSRAAARQCILLQKMPAVVETCAGATLPRATGEIVRMGFSLTTVMASG